MKPDEIQKLLGGYATGTLTEAERQALFAAALEDQQLFDDLAREQTLHDLLRDPAARAEMLGAVAGRPRAWSWWRPAAAALAMAAIGAVVFVMPRRKAPVAQPPRIVAEVKPPEPVLVPPPAKLDIPAAAVPRRATPAPAPSPKAKTFQPPPAAPPTPPPAADTILMAEAPKPAAPQGVAGGVIGGVPGGVLGGIISAPPGSAPPPPPPVKLESVTVSPRTSAFASTAETVEVTAAAPMAVRQTLSAMALFYGRGAAAARIRIETTAAADAAPPQRNLGLRYSIVRKEGNSFVPADPENLGKSDTLALRFTANVNGYLSLAGARPVALTAMQPYTTPSLPPGAAEVRVIFARSPQTVIAAPVSLTTEVSAGEVYVVNTTLGQPVAFTVTLKR